MKGWGNYGWRFYLCLAIRGFAIFYMSQKSPEGCGGVSECDGMFYLRFNILF